ncbi:MAG TPA: DUF4258 domain-containing protein [Chitinophagaceae bacterium]|nr:DUF4258 domain-containing protein [Chitinophagaceae bacterium]
MKNRKGAYILLAVLLVAALIISRTNRSVEPTQRPDKVNRDRGFDRRVSYLEYTRHARCRMECRQISQSEVEYIMKNGTINYRKSDVKDKPCPTYALEGYTADQQHVRIVFAQCNTKTKVVTCIDLEKEWQCHCN